MIGSLLANLGTSGLILLFLWVFTGSFGFPGSTVAMIAIGSLARGIPALVLISLISFVAVVLGDILAYELARKLSDRLRKILRKFLFFRDNESKARGLLNRYEFPIIFFTRFALIGLCVAVSYISGLEKVSRKKFIWAVIFGEFLFAVIYPLVGFAVGEIFGDLLNAINDFVLVALLFMLVFYLTKSLLYRKRAE